MSEQEGKTDTVAAKGEEKNDTTVNSNSGDTTEPAPQDQTQGTEENANDTSKTGGDEDDEEHNEEEEAANESPEKHSLRSSLFIKIIGFKRQSNVEEELKGLHKFFTEAVQVEAPLVQIPGPDDKWIYFEMKSLEDKAKLFRHIRKTQWEGQKLAAKVISIKPNIEVKELKQLSIEEGLKILYPLQDTLYAQQIKSKHTAAKELMNKLIVKSNVMKYAKSKKYIKNIRLREMLPMHPIEGYESSTLICTEMDASSGEPVYGIRVLSQDRESSVIIPLDKCVSVPQQTVMVAKRLIAVLPEVDVKPYNHSTKEGDLLGFTLRLTVYGSYMLTMIIPKVVALAFRQLTPEGADIPEGEKTEESYSTLIKKKIDGMKVKLEKFFNDHGSSLSIESVYLVMVHVSNLMTTMEDTNSGSFHIIGQKNLPEKLNGINLRMSWERDGQIEVFRPLLSLFEAQGNINSSTRLYLATPFRLLGLYFAKKCAHVTMYFFWTKEQLNELQQWAKDLGYTNLDFVNARSHLKKFANENAVTIFWQFTKPTLLEKFVSSDIRTIIIVSYWNKFLQENNINLQKKQLEAVYSKLKISYVCPFDLAPYKERYGMAFIFNHSVTETPEITARRMRQGKATPLKAVRRRPPFKSTYGKPQVSAFDRLGPQPYRSNYDDRSWGRPDPWMGQASQLDQVASGVMQNLQAVSQQMQAFIPSLLQGSQPTSTRKPVAVPPKRRYDDYSDDDVNNSRWSNQNDTKYDTYRKRRREDTYDNMYDNSSRAVESSGRWGGNNNWGGEQQADTRTYGDQSSSWGNTVREPAYYEKGRTTTGATGWNNTTNASNSWKNDGADWNNSSWSNTTRNYY